MAFDRRVQITVHRRAHIAGPGGIGGRAQFILQREQHFQTVTGNDRFGQPVIIEALHSACKEGRAAVHPPMGNILAGVHVFLVAADEHRHLQQRIRPQIRCFLAQMPCGIGEGERVGEIEPAHIVGQRAIARILPCRIVVQHVPRRRLQQRFVQSMRIARRAGHGQRQCVVDGGAFEILRGRGCAAAIPGLACGGEPAKFRHMLLARCAHEGPCQGQ